MSNSSCKIKVGDGDSDHLCWERAEDMSTPRTAFKVTTINRGSDVAAETAAAFAAASQAFRHYDSFYADVLVLHAKQVKQISPCQIIISLLHIFYFT